MSDAQDIKQSRLAREMALATAAGENGLWSPEDIYSRVNAGVDVPVGAKFKWTNLRDYLDLGLGGGGSPIESMDLEQYLQQTGMTPQQYQSNFGGLPLVFNKDGSVTYDPSAQRTAFEYTPASYGRNQTIGLSLLAMIGGAGLAGAGAAGAEAGAGMVGGGGAAELASVGATGSSMLGESLAAGAGSLAGGGAAELASLADTRSSMLGESIAGSGATAGAGAELAGATSGALDGVNWDLLNEAGTLSGTSAEGWNVASELAGIEGGAPLTTDGINWSSDIFDPNAPSSLNGASPEGWNMSDLATPATQAPAPVVNRDPGLIERSGLGKYLSQDTLDKLMKYGPALMGPLGLLQQRNAVKSATDKLSSIGGPTKAVGESIVNGFMNGTLNPADLAGIDKWERDSVAASRQFFARAGTSTSTQAVQSEADIRQKAEQMRQQARQNLLQTGISALGVTDKYQAAAIQAELQGDQQMAQYASNFLNSYGSWLRALPTLTGQSTAAAKP